ncbi:MAG: tetrathionate reductase family octaheme c-type cytochrome [Desulfobacula sp.]|uniref:tetrathionate reductase family octaheme c-type cytochrome n=1 Tax=Desulfobacula sp. TaxID=2593537 RepID=UPI001D7DB81A|nr:tetrathionate reductase family octaheme c-type cytochrome [Desulfobacula sp.]MBT3484747.1 tetrathionate reductase family octaheme c-type cytochrome [Desulfobacula sp.]MBT3804377.1 tetrathionate reductase family octaheme c-type cytochrome [Desulfobacula sp.]MBT4025168.1 tetrathionate reductase family octaheme c-type cytochrome [Desulfobacula sp.]MBT4198570.1 tetrathionate reductase family octaheme c-type cytochrome [Desulfobacula sp.]
MKQRYLPKVFMALIVISSLLFSFQSAFASTPKIEDEALGRTLARQAVKDNKRWSTIDHSKIDALNKDFKTGEEITKACISCHSEAATQFHKTIHWTWLASGDKKDIRYGKAGYSVNNFCISGNAMEDKGCLSCHTSWNKKGVEGDVNCLKCHNDSGFNFNEALGDIKAFLEDGDPDTNEIATDLQQEVKEAVSQVTFPTRKNCGDCHFKGGGGDGVKHGDLDTSLTKPNRMLDVHMGTDGKNFTCTRCHTTVDHHIAGRIYTNPAVETRKSLIEDDLAPKITCVSCHSDEPHKNDSKMNDHTNVVSCQACHIPEYARVNPTMMWWDWTKAGKMKNGKPYIEKGPFGKPVYKSIKGEFKWEKNVKPEYFWSNGSQTSTTINDVIDPAKVVKVSHPVGDKNDPESRIFPFKIHRGKQPYDKVNKKLLAPMLSGEKGYWETFDMNKAIEHGNKTLGIPYSGEFDYVETTYAFPITHMVAPKENALNCNQCHIRKNSRLANITGLYMPGRDKSSLMDTIGWLSVFGALAGVLLHGIGRFFTRNGKEE